MKYWQQATGDGDRNYVDLCVKWGVILNGPGSCGTLSEESIAKLKQWHISPRKITDLCRFAYEMQEGDIVVARCGTSEIGAVGTIQGNYTWSQAFADVDGWELEHVRRVDWFWVGNKKFETYSMKLGDTTQELTETKIIEWIDSLAREKADLPKMPNSGFELPIQEVKQSLFNHGININIASELEKHLEEAKLISRWYRNSQMPSESETIAYLVAPFLRILGWTPQKMAIEWNRVDLALFSATPRIANNLHILVEVKCMDQSCLSAKNQTGKYAQKYPKAKLLVLTDGIRYGIFKKQNDEWKITSYLNILSLSNSYPIYECQGAVEAILDLCRESVPSQAP